MSKKKSLQRPQSLPVNKKKKLFSQLDLVSELLPDYHPKSLIKDLEKDLELWKERGQPPVFKDEFITRVVTAREFEVGALMSRGLPEEMMTFAMKYSLELQEQYKCKDASSKALAELVALNYCRILELQKRINSYLELGTTSDLGSKHFAILSKEMDRAQRHYLSAMQMLMSMKVPPIHLNVKAKTANVAYQQVVQEERRKYGI